jgi:hypothetical protein
VLGSTALSLVCALRRLKRSHGPSCLFFSGRRLLLLRLLLLLFPTSSLVRRRRPR